MDLNAQLCDAYGHFLRERCGLFLPDVTPKLLRERLARLVERHGCTGYREFFEQMHLSGPGLIDEVISAMTTQDTSFFRDLFPFQAFAQQMLPQLEKLVLKRKSQGHSRRGSKVNIWCAASASGQEAYSLAMLISEYVHENSHRGLHLDDFSILATDISAGVLARAVAGRFSRREVKTGMNDFRLRKYFYKENSEYVVCSELAQMVVFRRCDLRGSLDSLPSFDVIYCRNVLSCFDDVTRHRIFDNMGSRLAPNGYLVLGSGESIYRNQGIYDEEWCGPSRVFRKKENANKSKGVTRAVACS